MVVRICSYSFR